MDRTSSSSGLSGERGKERVPESRFRFRTGMDYFEGPGGLLDSDPFSTLGGDLTLDDISGELSGF